MKPVTACIAILMTQCLLPLAHAQIGDSDTVAEDVPGFPGTQTYYFETYI